MRQHSPDACTADDISPTTSQSRRASAISQHASDLCHRHAGALYSLARLLYQDTERAEEAAVTALAQAAAVDDGPAGLAQERRALASRLVRDHRRHTADHGGVPDHPAGFLTQQERALLGLVLFGGLTGRQAASVTGVSYASAALGLRSLLRRANAQGGVGPAPSPTAAVRGAEQ
ncbi:hypothetical protein [Streptomyces tremellae]|uniref:HTH luxR-type domain-containing protein n=1 Tax=Streptomyces tremellae TaxID=1124239 RepID=A0ABP7EN61_9ACTN